MRNVYPFSIDGLRTHVPLGVKKYIKYRLSQNNAFHFLYQRYLRDFLCLREQPRAVPRSITIEATNHCNAHCAMCPRNQMQRATGFMNLELYAKVISECVQHRVGEIKLHNFGEPLLHPRIVRMIQVAKENKLRVSLFTNGFLLDRDIFESMAEAGLDELWVSLDSSEREDYESMRIGLAYDRVKSNLEFCIAARNNMAKKPRIFISHIMLNPGETKRFTQAWKGKTDGILPVFYHDWAGRNKLKEEERPLRRWPCPLLWKRMFVFWNGDVSFCCRDINGEMVLGNVASESLRTVYLSQGYRELRRLHLHEQYEAIPICRNCKSLVFF